MKESNVLSSFQNVVNIETCSNLSCIIKPRLKIHSVFTVLEQ